MTPAITAEDVNEVFRGDVYGEDDIFTERSFADFVHRNDIDAGISQRVADREGLIGVMLAGRREERGWFGAFGVVPEFREAGHGRRIFAAALERSRAAGITSIEFEVLQRNEIGVRLYRSFGFETIDELLVWERAPRKLTTHDLTFASRSESEIAAQGRYPAACWQREPRSVARAQRSALVTSDGAYAYLHVANRQATVLDAAAADEDAARALLLELDRRVAEGVTLFNEPAASPLSKTLHDAQWHVVELQYRMRLLL